MIGASYEGRELWAVKLSDNVGVDEGEPEVLLSAGQHAREHLTIEMALYLIGELTSRYATDPRIKGIVDSREIWIIPNVNPDGSEYDLTEDRYHAWRKNRQPNPCSEFVGTDLNRNWGFKWGCCGGSSDQFALETYRGPSAFSAPGDAGGAQLRREPRDRRRAAAEGLDRLPRVLGADPVAVRPHARRHRARASRRTTATRSRRSGQGMARTNGYTAQQSSDLYITDGALDDWLWGAQKIFAYTFEMYPQEGGSAGFYPGDELIGRETSRNREAVLLLLENAACPQAVIGKAAQYCGTAPLTTLFAGKRGEADAADRADRRRQLRRQLPLPLDQAHEQRPPAGRRRRHPHAVPRARALATGGRRRRSASAASPGGPCASSSSRATRRSTRWSSRGSEAHPSSTATRSRSPPSA